MTTDAMRDARRRIAEARRLVAAPDTPEWLRLRLIAKLDQLDAAIEGIRELGDVARHTEGGS